MSDFHWYLKTMMATEPMAVARPAANQQRNINHSKAMAQMVTA
jgi:hypothetical protein